MTDILYKMAAKRCPTTSCGNQIFPHLTSAKVMDLRATHILIYFETASKGSSLRHIQHAQEQATNEAYGIRKISVIVSSVLSGYLSTLSMEVMWEKPSRLFVFNTDAWSSFTYILHTEITVPCCHECVTHVTTMQRSSARYV